MSAAELTALEAIFSCGICFASYSDIYKHDDKIVDTLNDPGFTLPGTAPRLWMTSCGHVICGKHLEGGAPLSQAHSLKLLMDTTDKRGYQGAPFHPAGVDMMTRCTVCTRDFSKTEDVALYPIWGVTDGFYDARLPKAFFKVPPVKFDKIYFQDVGSFEQGREPSRREREATEHAREALRFQFISLICYAKGIRAKLSETERERDELCRKFEHQLKVAKEENVELLTSLHHLDDQREKYRGKLVILEEQRAAWRQKKRMAVHYLSLVGALADENAMLKRQLVSFGHPVKETNYAFDETEIQFLSSDRIRPEAGVESNIDEPDAIIPEDKGKKRIEPGANNADRVHGIQSISDPKKRKYLPSRGEASSKARSKEDLRSIHRQLSRDDMPPPPLPLGTDHAQTVTNASLFTASHGADNSPSLEPFGMSLPIVTTRQMTVDQDIAMLDQQSDGQMNWPFVGPNQIDATRGQTATSTYSQEPRTSHVSRLESMEWVKNGSESSNLLAQRDTAYTSSGNMNGASMLLQPRPDLATTGAQSNTRTGTATHEPPSAQVIAQGQNGRHGSVPLTEASLATLREQLHQTVPYSHRQDRQRLSSMSKVMPLLDRDYPSLIKDGSIVMGSAADKAEFRNSVRYTHRRSVESVQDRPILERGSSYNEEGSRMSIATPPELPILERGSSYNISQEAGSIPGEAVSISHNVVNLVPVPPMTSPRGTLDGISTAPLWQQGLSNFGSSASNPNAKQAVIQTDRKNQSNISDWFVSQSGNNRANSTTSQRQPRLSVGGARGLVSKSSNWIKRNTKGLRNLASRSTSVSSPFFRREDMGAPRRPSPTMEESESYEVYQRFRTGDRPRTIASRIGNPHRDISSAMRSAAIREHIFGSPSPEDILSTSPPFHRPFTPAYASPNIAIVETSFGGSRTAPSSGRRVVRR